MSVTWVRRALGLYLIFVFLSVACMPAIFLTPPYAWPTGILSFLHIPLFSPLGFRALGAFGCVLAGLFALGRFPRVLPWLLWLCLVLVVGQIPRMREVQFDYLGFLLIFFGLAPKEWNSEWRRVGLIVLAVSYMYTGAFKLTNQNWGAPDNWLLFEMVLRFPGQTWMIDPRIMSAVIWLQLLALPGVLWKRTAFFTWAALTGMQLWILFALKMEHVSIGVLIVHFAFMDPAWRKRGA